MAVRAITRTLFAAREVMPLLPFFARPSRATVYANGQRRNVCYGTSRHGLRRRCRCAYVCCCHTLPLPRHVAGASSDGGVERNAAASEVPAACRRYVRRLLSLRRGVAGRKSAARYSDNMEDSERRVVAAATPPARVTIGRGVSARRENGGRGEIREVNGRRRAAISRCWRREGGDRRREVT